MKTWVYVETAADQGNDTSVIVFLDTRGMTCCATVPTANVRKFEYNGMVTYWLHAWRVKYDQENHIVAILLTDLNYPKLTRYHEVQWIPYPEEFDKHG